MVISIFPVRSFLECIWLYRYHWRNRNLAFMLSGQKPLHTISARKIGLFNWIGLWTLYLKEVKRFMKVWLQTVVAPTFTTLLFMAIFSLALGGMGREVAGVPFGTFLAPGLVMMTILQNAYQNPSSSILISKVQGNIVDVLMPPLSAGELAFGYVMGGITRGVIVGLAILVTFFFWPGIEVEIQHWGLFFYFLLSGATLLSLAGVVAGVWAEKFDHAAGLNNFIIIPLSLLSGTFYSIERLPELAQKISLVNPFFYLIDGFRYSMIGRADSDITVGIWMTLGLNIVLWLLVYKIFKSGYKLKP